MNTHKGFGLVAVLIVIAGLLVLGGGTYVVLNPKAAVSVDDGLQKAPGDHPEEDHDATDGMQAGAKTSITWKFTDMDFDANNTPHTEVTAVVNGTEYVVGTYDGTCTEINETSGTINLGVDGGGLLAGELAAVQCWWGGGGVEVGVFAHEDGGYQIMVGQLDEGSAEAPGFRGDFKIKTDIRI